jgi:hypothetical protein
MREAVAGPGTSAGVWKASKHKVVCGPFDLWYVEATPDAQWAKTDPFGTYEPAGDRGRWSKKQLPHETFRKLADMAPEFSVSCEGAGAFSRAVEGFANCYGMLGLLRDDLGTPLLPGSGERVTPSVAPDAMIDETGRLHDIDPATDGKRLLEELINELDRRIYAERGELHLWKREELDLSRSTLVWPEELRFQKPALDFTPLAISWTLPELNHDEIFSYEDAQDRYGVRVVFDPWADAGVSLISTREPVRKWRDELRGFARDVSWEDLDRRLEGGIRPRAVPGKDRREAEHWYCATLLKAIYLMRYLDLNSGTKMLKCQAPDCLEYFRVGPRSRPRKYCPPPPGKKESRCTSRASSAMYRKRERQKSDGG